MSRATLSALLAALLAGCGEGGEQAGDPVIPSYTPPDVEPPVAVSAEPTIQYPPALYERRVQGDVVLRLFVNATGELVPDSTRVAESSGFPALDSAALAGVTALRYAPARRRGVPVATAFLQPVEFRHPEGASNPGPP